MESISLSVSRLPLRPSVAWEALVYIARFVRNAVLTIPLDTLRAFIELSRKLHDFVCLKRFFRFLPLISSIAHQETSNTSQMNYTYMERRADLLRLCFD